MGNLLLDFEKGAYYKPVSGCLLSVIGLCLILTATKATFVRTLVLGVAHAGGLYGDISGEDVKIH